MGTTVERGQDARRRLVQAAGQLVAERGWGAVTTRVLAQRAGVAAGVVHYHFASVQAVLVQAVAEAAREMAAETGTALGEAGSAGEAVEVLLNALDRYSGTDPVSLLFLEAYLASARDEDLRCALGREVAEVRRQVADRLATFGVPEPTTTAAVLLATVDGVMLHRALTPGPPPAALGDVVRRLLNPTSSEVGR